MMGHCRKDIFPPLCLTVSISSTHTPTLKSFPKVLKIYRQKVPYNKPCLHFNREQEQPKKGAGFAIHMNTAFSHLEPHARQTAVSPRACSSHVQGYN